MTRLKRRLKAEEIARPVLLARAIRGTGCGERGRAGGSPHSRIKSPFSDPSFALAFAGIRRRVVQIETTEIDDLITLWGLVDAQSVPSAPTPDSSRLFQVLDVYLALAGIRRLAVHIKVVGRDGLLPV